MIRSLVPVLDTKVGAGSTEGEAPLPALLCTSLPLLPPACCELLPRLELLRSSLASSSIRSRFSSAARFRATGPTCRDVRRGSTSSSTFMSSSATASRRLLTNEERAREDRSARGNAVDVGWGLAGWCGGDEVEPLGLLEGCVSSSIIRSRRMLKTMLRTWEEKVQGQGFFLNKKGHTFSLLAF